MQGCNPRLRGPTCLKWWLACQPAMWRQILTWEESVPGTLKRTAIFCTWKMDGKGIRPRFGLFGFISAYFCSWCVLLVSGKGISRSSGPHSFKCSGSMYLVCLWRSYMRWWKGGIFTIKLKPRDCRIIPTLILEDTNLHPWSFNMVHLKIRPWNRRFPTWRAHHFQVNHVKRLRVHGFAQIFFLHSEMSSSWSWGWYVWYIKRCSVSTPGSWRLCVTRFVLTYMEAKYGQVGFKGVGVSRIELRGIQADYLPICVPRCDDNRQNCTLCTCFYQ